MLVTSHQECPLCHRPTERMVCDHGAVIPLDCVGCVCGKTRSDVLTRIKTKTTVTDTGCWEWSGCLTGKGRYAKMTLYRRTWRVSRLLWTVINGKVPKGAVVCHTCDNPKCVRLSHMFLGTPLDNVRDMMAKGRASFSAHKITCPKHRARMDRKNAKRRAQRSENANKMIPIDGKTTC